MDNFGRDLDDLLNLTDSDDNSSSSNGGVFENNELFVLELHDLKKDEPASQTKETPQEVKRRRRERRKKHKNKENVNTEATSDTSSSLSDSAPAVRDEANKEEFYDARESYYALPENQATPTAALVLAQVHSGQVQDPKSLPQRTASETPSATLREPSTINVSNTSTLYTNHTNGVSISPQISIYRAIETRLQSSIVQPNLKQRHPLKPFMEKPARYKAKNKKPTAKTQPKTAKKRKSDGPTCSMFLAELTRKLALKKKQEAESPKNVVQMIIDSITNALPVKFSKKSPSKKESPMKIETLQTYAPELLPNDLIDIPSPDVIGSDTHSADVDEPVVKPGFKIPKMPIINSDVIKIPEKKHKLAMEDVAVNTSGDHDVAGEIAKHVNTLRRISLIAEEFNQKTAKNLKEIVDSVQEDLMKKLEEVKAEEKAQLEKTVTIAEEPITAPS